MKKLALALFVLTPLLLCAQSAEWQDIDQPVSSTGKHLLQTKTYRLLQLQEEGWQARLQAAPSESTVALAQSPFQLQLPNPAGGWDTFRMVNSPVMAEGLARQFPGIQTYLAKGISNPRAVARLDFTPQGFHAMVLQGAETYFIDPYYHGLRDGTYAAYYKKDYASAEFECHTEGLATDAHEAATSSQVLGEEVRIYRTAVAATGEYTQFHGGTVEMGLSAIVTTLNRINMVYEADISARMVLVDSNHLVVYTDPATDPYSGGAASHLDQNQSNITSVIGSPNFDLGHVFHRAGNNGIAGFQALCRNNRKAQGFTAVSPPIGDPIAIDYGAHEFGHQFGANHTQNNQCQRVQSSAVEPGSASTIMGYAGICPPNLQNNSDPYFHAISQQEMINYSLDGFGGNCAAYEPTGNTSPIVSAGESGLVIPVSTPFELAGSAVDAEGDSLTYCWEQMDTGPSGSPNNPSGNAPLFRSFLPATDSVRVFPRLSDLVNNTTVIGEILPDYARSMNFRLTVRDNFGNGGGVGFDDRSLLVTDAAGPFVVETQNEPEPWRAGALQLVAWDVANTNQAPVNTDSVHVYLSADGGFTYPYLLAGPVANDGLQLVGLPDTLQGDQFRLKVKASNNVFFDINNANFPILPATEAGLSVGTENSSLQLCAGDTLAYSIRIEPVLAEADTVSFSTEGLPAGLVLELPDSLLVPAAASLQVYGTETLSSGTYTFSLIAQGKSVADTIPLQLAYFEGAPGPVELLSPAPGAVDISINTGFLWSEQPDATSYTFEVSADPFFDDILLQRAGISGNSLPSPFSLPDSTEVFWRVTGANEACGAGVPATSSFNTERIVCEQFSAEGLPLDLGSGPPFSISELTVGIEEPIRDVNVLPVVGQYSPLDALEIFLVSPEGTSVDLYERDCDTSTPFFTMSFDADAEEPVDCPPLGGPFRPRGNLKILNGENPNGNWQLALFKTGNDGELSGWGLEICYPALTNSADGELSAAAASFELFPNPAGSQVQLQWNGQRAALAELRLLSATGQQLRSWQPEGPVQRMLLQLDGLPAGIYALQARAADGRLLGVRRLVKSR